MFPNSRRLASSRCSAATASLRRSSSRYLRSSTSSFGSTAPLWAAHRRLVMVVAREAVEVSHLWRLVHEAERRVRGAWVVVGPTAPAVLEAVRLVHWRMLGMV